jgi:PAS domain S-box-containing protein
MKDKNQMDETRIKVLLEYSNSIIATLREPFLVIDKKLRVISANHAFYTIFEVAEKDTIGQLLPDLGNSQWNIPKLIQLLKEIIPEKKLVKDYEVEHKFEQIGERAMILNACQLRVSKKIAGIMATGVREEEGGGGGGGGGGEEEEEELILLAIEDITKRREIENGLEKALKELEVTKISDHEAREYAESIINTVRDPLIALDQDLRVVTASRSFYVVFKVSPKETVGQLIYDLGNKQWDIPKLRELLETILPQRATFDDYEVEHNFATIGRRIMLLNAQQIQRVSGKERIILLAIEDITERKRLQEEVEASEERYRRAFETSHNVLLLIHKTEGDILNSNASAQKMLGYSKEELLKKKLWEIGVIKNDKDFQEAVSRSERDGAIHYEDILVKTKQGLNINSEIFLIDKAKVIQCNIRDITEGKKLGEESEKRLRELEVFYKASVGREERIIELKKEIEQLKKELGK